MEAATAAITGGITSREADLDLRAGQYVRHAKYGWGTIVDYDRHHTLVIFRKIGLKKLQTDPRNFALVPDELPKKKPRA